MSIMDDLVTYGKTREMEGFQKAMDILDRRIKIVPDGNTRDSLVLFREELHGEVLEYQRFKPDLSE